jgi:hypothetical protein
MSIRFWFDILCIIYFWGFKSVFIHFWLEISFKFLNTTFYIVNIFFIFRQRWLFWFFISYVSYLCTWAIWIGMCQRPCIWIGIVRIAFFFSRLMRAWGLGIGLLSTLLFYSCILTAAMFNMMKFISGFIDDNFPIDASIWWLIIIGWVTTLTVHGIFRLRIRLHFTIWFSTNHWNLTVV